MINKFGQVSSPRFGESGAAPVLVLVAVIGLIGFLAIASTASFKKNTFSTIFPKEQSQAATVACSLSNAAFCETFDQGPSAVRGRGGDLDPSKWGVGRLAPSDISGGGGSVANPVQVAPIPGCKSTFLQTNVYPPNDTLICDPSGTRTAQLMTAVAIQNYGNNSYMIRQPFDFAGRTGKIDFDVDGSGYQFLGGYPEIDITEDPVPAPTFQEFGNFETGPVPKNAIIVKFSQGGGCSSTQASPINVMVYNGYTGTILPSAGTIGCVNVLPGSLNHYEIQLSQSHIDIYGSDYSTDNGQTFTNLHKIYSANINLPFTRGYVHIDGRNHATEKYFNGLQDAVFHWDNIGFDGPVLPTDRAYEIPDNTTMGTYLGHTIMNLGYMLLDGTTGKPAGIYDPNNKLNPFQFTGVNISGATGARLSMNTSFQTITHTADMTWGWTYRFNGGTWRTRTLTAQEVSAINNVTQTGSAGNLSLIINVPLADLISGTNTFEILPVNAPMDYPPVVANIDLLLSTTGATATPTPTPTSLPSTTPPASTPTPTPAGQSPFNGPHNLPGKLEVEDFDNGGEGVAYHDLEAANQGGAYRTAEGVDVQATTDTGGGFNVGWTVAGEYLEYTVNVGTSGNYNLVARVASQGQGGVFHIEVDGVDKSGALTIPDTTNWQTFTDLTKTNVALTAGAHVLRMVMDTNSAGGWIGNINYLNITSASSPSASPNPLPGDINGSKKVDILDYNLMITDFGATSGLGLRSDINSSGKVDILDYNLLITNYGKSIP